jgi:integrase
MTIKVREWKRGKQVGFEVDIRFTYPDGTPYRRRIKAPVESKSSAKRWGEAKERELLMSPSPIVRERGLPEQREEKQKEVPTLEQFAPRFINSYARAERHKASGIDTKERIFRLHLIPALASKRLDEITDEDVQELKAAMADKSRKTINNVLTVLSKALHVAVSWKVISAMPCTIKLLKTSAQAPDFYEFDAYGSLVNAAAKIDPRALLVVLLGGDAGLRRGEMIGLRWCDIDFRRKQITVQQAVWNGIIDTPKSGKGRVIPMTNALEAALRSFRHLRGERVLYLDSGKPPLDHHLREWLEAAQRRAGLPKTTGGTHILRHSFCSHLAMRGAPVKAIQELAGHANLTTTLRYMHLSPSARASAIGLLNDRRDFGQIFGEILETRSSPATGEPFSR